MNRGKEDINRFGKGIGASLLAMIMVLSIAVPMVTPVVAAPVKPGQNAIAYLEPKDSTASYGNNQTVEVYVNSTVPIRSGKMTIVTSNNACGNITGANWNQSSCWFYGAANVYNGGNKTILGFAATSDQLASVYNIGSFTVQCESAGSCSCYLNFTSETYIYNGTGGTVMDIDVSTDCVENGTFTCTAEEAPINVDLRADSITGNIFDVSGYTINPGTVTEDGLTINNQTAMGAMVVYCQENGINVNITTGYWGEYVLQIGNNASDYNYWCYAVNEVVPWVGGAAYDLSGGEFVHWSNCGLNCYTVLTTLNTTSVEVGDYLTATVTWKNVSGIHPLNGASVYETDTLDEWGYPTTGTSVGTTGPDGNCTFQATTPSRWYVYAVDPVHGSGQYNYPPVSFTCTATEFDTNEGTYPSIFGTHYGKIIPDQNLTVNKIYTYPCAGTGGHTEYVIIWNESECAVAEWDGYIGDYHNLSFNRTLRLQKDVVYSYIIRTGSYPQIIHAPYKPVTGGNISCTKFIDANERVYHDWIPAIRLW